MYSPTMETLRSVKAYVLKRLTVAEIESIDIEDLTQEIYAIALETMRVADHLEDLEIRTLARVRNKLRNRRMEGSMLCLFDDINQAAIRQDLQRKKEQERARDTIDDLLEVVLSPIEEACIRLRYGIASTEMIDKMNVEPQRQYGLHEIVVILGVHNTPTSPESFVDGLIRRAIKKLSCNAKAFYLIH